MKKTAAVVILIGAAIAIFGEFQPVVLGIWGGGGSGQTPAEIIAGDPIGWAIAMYGMAFGGLIVGAGLWLFARDSRGVIENKTLQTLLLVSAVLTILGALFHGYLRVWSAIDPQAFVDGSIPGFLFSAYTVLTRLAKVFFGYVLVKSRYSTILGYLTLGFVVLGIASMGWSLTSGSPAEMNIPHLIVGLVLLFKPSTTPEAVPESA